MLKKSLIALCFCSFTTIALNAADFQIGVSGSDNGIDGFSLSIGNYYHVPQPQIVEVRNHVNDDEMGVVYLLSQRSNRDAGYITNLRNKGLSWWDITLRLGLDPYSVYAVDAPSYGKNFGHKRMEDKEIIDRTNIQFLSKYYHVRPDEIISHRERGERYDTINDRYWKQKKHDNRGNKNYNRDDRDDEQDYPGNSGHHRKDHHHDD